MHGFKSFAKKAVLDFIPSYEGRHSITAVVGPNGSGKSNIADAVRWVMGEQSLKALRGKKSADVIFSGSEHKGQMGMASVAITLDNSDNRAGIGYEELVITRRLYRSGESEYLINGSSVRLLDLQLLLAKAQFGQGSYSVISQGMIDRLLLQTPQERKEFFDEAVGIKEFQIKRHQASLKMHRTQENIEQAEMLLSEVSPRMRSLSRQVKKLEKRNDIDVQLREVQEQYYGSLFHHNNDRLQELKQKLIGINKEFSQVSGRLTSVQTEMAELAKEKTSQAVFEHLQQDQQRLVRQKNNFERERAVLQGRLQTEYSKVGQQNVGWLENKIEVLENEQSRIDSELSEAEALLDLVSREILKGKQGVEQIMKEKAELRTKIAGLEQKVAQSKSEQSYWQYSGLKAVQAVLEERHRLGTIFGTVAQLGEVEEDYCLALDVAAGGHLSSVVVDGNNTAQGCIEYLRDQQLGVATFLPLGKVRPRLVSQDMQELAGRSGVVGLAVDLVKFDKKFTDLFSYVLGNTLIVENLDVAREIGMGRVRMVTLDGDVVETSGSMKGGYRGKEKSRRLSFSHGDSPYLLQGKDEDQHLELEELQKRLIEKELEYEQAQDKLREIQSQSHIAGSKASTLGMQKQSISQELSGFKQEYSLTTMSPEQFGDKMQEIGKQKEYLDKEIQELEQKLEKANKKIEEFNQKQEEKKQRIFTLQEVMQSEQSGLNKIVDERNECQVELAKIETRLENLENEAYQEMHTSLSSVKAKGFELLGEDELESLLENIQKLKYQLSLIGGIDEEVVTEYHETKEKHDGLVGQLNDLKKAILDLEKLVKELDAMMKKKRKKGFQEIKKEFTRYFSLLFDGGKADLIELYGEKIDQELEDELDEEEVRPRKKEEILLGIDISACPPGKKIRNIQALSGGERTLTSIALICAILCINPSPFVVLDEVEAALDEANTQRFAKILHELSHQSQFIMITHNRVTMHAADALYGVTMGNGGVSHLLSVKLDDVEKMDE